MGFWNLMRSIRRAGARAIISEPLIYLLNLFHRWESIYKESIPTRDQRGRPALPGLVRERLLDREKQTERGGRWHISPFQIGSQRANPPVKGRF